MNKIFKKEQILTVPNFLSAIRLVMIPLIIWFYTKENTLAAVTVLVISGATDVLDGYIARKFSMVSDFGKILDPVADKLTQGAVIICLASKRPIMWVLVCFFIFKELLMSFVGLIAIYRQDCVNSSKWYGKLNTVVLYVVMALLILFPNMPEALSNSLIALCGGTMLLSLILYLRFYSSLFRKWKNDKMRHNHHAKCCRN